MQSSFIFTRNLQLESFSFINVLLGKVDNETIVLHNAIVQGGKVVREGDVLDNWKVISWYRVLWGDPFIKKGEIVLEAGLECWWGQTDPFESMSHEVLKQVELGYIDIEISILESRRDQILGIKHDTKLSELIAFNSHLSGFRE
jgi:hypothetical protein